MIVQCIQCSTCVSHESHHMRGGLGVKPATSLGRFITSFGGHRRGGYCNEIDKCYIYIQGAQNNRELLKRVKRQGHLLKNEIT